MKERVVIIFIAVTLGLLATTIGFFLYESSKPAKPMVENQQQQAKKQPTPNDGIKLIISSPQDETITTNRTISVKGQTDPQNTIIISTNQEDAVVSPTQEGTFSASISIDASVNKLIVEAIAPDGTSKKEVRTISFSPEDF